MIIIRKTISKQVVNQFEKEWIENCEKAKEKWKELSKVSEKANGDVTEEVKKVEQEYMDILKETKMSFKKYTKKLYWYRKQNKKHTF